MVNILQSFRVWSKLKRWKSRCLLSWLQTQAIIVLVSVSFILCSNIEPFLNRILTCNETWVFWQSVMTSSVAGLRISSIALPKARFAPKKKKVLVTVWRSAANQNHYSFLNPNETIASEKYAKQIDEVRWKPQCMRPAWVNRKGPILLRDNGRPHVAQPTLQKLNTWHCQVFPHRSFHLTSCQPATTSSSLLTTFCREDISTTSQRQIILPKGLSNPPEAWIMLQE